METSDQALLAEAIHYKDHGFLDTSLGPAAAVMTPSPGPFSAVFLKIKMCLSCRCGL